MRSRSGARSPCRLVDKRHHGFRQFVAPLARHGAEGNYLVFARFQLVDESGNSRPTLRYGQLVDLGEGEERRHADRSQKCKHLPIISSRIVPNVEQLYDAPQLAAALQIALDEGLPFGAALLGDARIAIAREI